MTSVNVPEGWVTKYRASLASASEMGVCSCHRLSDVSNVRLLHEEASGQCNAKVCHPLHTWLGKTHSGLLLETMYHWDHSVQMKRNSHKDVNVFYLSFEKEFLRL